MATGVTSILSSLMGLWVGAAGFPMALPDIHPGLRQWEGQDRLKLRATSLSALRVRLGVENRLSPPCASSSHPASPQALTPLPLLAPC